MGMLTGAIDTGAPAARSHRSRRCAPMPSIAWVPMFILWLGIFETSKLALIAVGVFFPVYLGCLGAIQGVDRKLIEVGRVFGLSRLGIMLRITWPAVLPIWIAVAAQRARSGLHVRRRRRIDGRVGRPGLPAGRWPADGPRRTPSWWR